MTRTNHLLTLDSVDAQWIVRDVQSPGDDFMVFDEYEITAAPDEASTGPDAGLEVTAFSPQGVTLRFVGQPGTTYMLEASTDLRGWTELGTLSSTDGLSEFTDSASAGFSARFYRARPRE
jgi:hypothetical protein